MLVRIWQLLTKAALPVVAVLATCNLLSCSSYSSSYQSNQSQNSQSQSSRSGSSSSSASSGSEYHSSESHNGASVNWDSSSKALHVDVTVSGLAPASSHAAQIYLSDCNGRQNSYSLNRIEADSNGNADSSTTVDNVVNLVGPFQWHINIDGGPEIRSSNPGFPGMC